MPRKRSARTEANDDDDWHHISDQTLRKRIQNRVAQRKHQFQNEMNLWPYPAELPRNGSFPYASSRSPDGASDTSISATFNDVGLNMAANTASLSGQPAAQMVQSCDDNILRRPNAMPWSAGSYQEGCRNSKSLNQGNPNFTDQSLLHAPTAAKGSPQSYHSNSCNDTAGLSRCIVSQNEPEDYFNTPSSALFDLHFGRNSSSSTQDNRDGSSTEDRSPHMYSPHMHAPKMNNEDPQKANSGIDSPRCLATRIEKAIEAICELGFDSVDELATQYYTADLQHRPALQHRRQLSRRRGLVDLLRSIAEDSRDKWTEWEVQRYRDEVLRSAEEVLDEEFSRFVKLYGNGKTTEGNLVEQRRRFQDKLPNLSSLLSVLGMSVQPQGNADRTAATVCVISVLLDSLDVRSPNQ
ncbi:hypothetical protein P3342_004698 [Pyrenophora teres f. teres]|uniref:Uncharacterized protein n=1 Tax=Pyrenophora teres f. teres TaxID=97479 RepID=A0A6S6VD63_9PLEO|nr:hypothetical protein PTNB85_09832 [Pyrenophora teres f. teres]KAE8855422.1 hypothetical protein PTNB73_10079 [Pyrenophora teres f. teres]KAE8868605.1 hypothetical protein PTNB29_02516 [Pyrenophora teres f. teres]KAK1912762.1 hypothetical protein P3342_004698 [Pyrenophora teres f. teres]CAE7021160.1 hypothetical protein PTTW11_03208 [Pyrenophora teres f. teres]